MLKRLVLGLFVCLVASGAAQERVSDQIYMKSGGAAFTMDVFKPKQPTGAGVIFLVSGGWFSSHEQINPMLALPFSERGITLFVVVHGSQPRYKVPEIVDQVRRAVRYVRHRSKDFGVDPERLGITGGSAGGHLSLMVGGMADEGDAEAKDAVDRQPSKVSAIVAIFPPTDFLNYGKIGQAAFDIPALRVFMPAWVSTTNPPKSEIDRLSADYSPIRKVSSKFPPTLLIHGDEDALVPLQQSEVMLAELKKAGVESKLIVGKGLGHDGRIIVQEMASLLTWFEEKLTKKGK